MCCECGIIYIYVYISLAAVIISAIELLLGVEFLAFPRG